MSEEPERSVKANDEDIALLVGLRRGDAAMIRTFSRRFYLVLSDQARRLGVERAERDTVVTSFLDDIVMKLARTHIDESLSRFVVTAFRNSVIDAYRADRRRGEIEHTAASGEDGENLVKFTCSQYTLGAALGLDSEQGATVIAATLVGHLMRNCTSEERQLLVWASRRVPMREVARWLGISYDATKQRVSRLRARLSRDAIAVLPTLEGSDAEAMKRLLERIGLVRASDDRNSGTAA